MAIFTLSVGTFFTSCENSAKKVENAEENLTDAKEDLDEARADYQEDIANYRLQTADRYEENNEKIAAFNLKMAKEKEDIRAQYNTQMAELELKNREMKMKMDEYSADSNDEWQNFKIEFKRDMDQLEQALSDLTTTND